MEYEDRLTIRTPEGVDMALTLAGVGSRFIAAIVDSFIQSLLLLASWLAFVASGLGGVGEALFAIALFLVFFAYDVTFEVLAAGRTPGKRWAGLRVVRTGGQPVGFLTSAIRNLLRLVDFLPGFYLVGIASVLATRHNQRLGDLAAGTVVVRARRGRLSAMPQPPARPVAPALAGWDVSGVTAEEVAAVRSFLERRQSLTHGARVELARTMAARLRPRVGGLGEDTVRGDEAFLEQLVRVKAARG